MPPRRPGPGRADRCGSGRPGRRPPRPSLGRRRGGPAGPTGPLSARPGPHRPGRRSPAGRRGPLRRRVARGPRAVPRLGPARTVGSTPLGVGMVPSTAVGRLRAGAAMARFREADAPAQRAAGARAADRDHRGLAHRHDLPLPAAGHRPQAAGPAAGRADQPVPGGDRRPTTSARPSSTPSARSPGVAATRSTRRCRPSTTRAHGCPRSAALAMGTDLRNWAFTSTTRLDTYADVARRRRTWARAYVGYRQVLEALDRGDGRRWVLKAPPHTRRAAAPRRGLPGRGGRAPPPRHRRDGRVRRQPVRRLPLDLQRRGRRRRRRPLPGRPDRARGSGAPSPTGPTRVRGGHLRRPPVRGPGARPGGRDRGGVRGHRPRPARRPRGVRGGLPRRPPARRPRRAPLHGGRLRARRATSCASGSPSSTADSVAGTSAASAQAWAGASSVHRSRFSATPAMIWSQRPRLSVIFMSKELTPRNSRISTPSGPAV